MSTVRYVVSTSYPQKYTKLMYANITTFCTHVGANSSLDFSNTNSTTFHFTHQGANSSKYYSIKYEFKFRQVYLTYANSSQAFSFSYTIWSSSLCITIQQTSIFDYSPNQENELLFSFFQSALLQIRHLIHQLEMIFFNVYKNNNCNMTSIWA